MPVKTLPKTIRRSVALPRHLVDEVSALAPAELHGNLNRLVTTALQEYAAARRRQAFEEAMARMAADPAIRAESGAIAMSFRNAEADGLNPNSAAQPQRTQRNRAHSKGVSAPAALLTR
jgi:hypothetical protein